REEALSRRNFLARSGAGAAELAIAGSLGGVTSPAYASQTVKATAPPSKSPSGIELYAVRGELAKNLPATLRAVSQMGYEVVEFYAPYLGWTLPYAKEVRTQLDDLGLRCYSTHNSFAALTPGDTMTKAIELNQIIGARHVILAAPPNAKSIEHSRRVSGQLASAAELLKPHGLSAGFHNHLIEWNQVD